jgi:hypothetical protein
MESEEINKALHRYVLAVLRARDASESLTREQAKASDNTSERVADTREHDSIGELHNLYERTAVERAEPDAPDRRHA